MGKVIGIASVFVFFLMGNIIFLGTIASCLDLSCSYLFLITLFHAERQSSESLKDMLSNKFYVDNLIVTQNNKTELLEAGKQLASSMAEVGLP